MYTIYTESIFVEFGQHLLNEVGKFLILIIYRSIDIDNFEKRIRSQYSWCL